MVNHKCRSNKLVCCYKSPSPWLEWGPLYWLFSEGSTFLGNVFLVWLNIWKIFKFKATVKAHVYICNQNLTASTIFYGTADPFSTRLCLMVYHSKLECLVKRLGFCVFVILCVEGQDHSESSKLYWMFVSPVFSVPLISLYYQTKCKQGTLTSNSNIELHCHEAHRQNLLIFVAFCFSQSAR